MKLYLDDVRNAPPGWIRCLTASEVIEWLKLSELSSNDTEITHVSLDHDLGMIEETGYEVIKFFQQRLVDDNWGSYIPIITCHSDNPVGRKDVELGIRSIHRLAKQKMVPILEPREPCIIHATPEEKKSNCADGQSI